jgi:phosphoglycerate dehydrogenase-like enzyme
VTTLRIAVLDDYQDVAGGADWSSVPGTVEVDAFRHHIDDLDELVAALRSYDVVVAMRERTPLGAALFARLPDLRLVVTTGPRNAVIDVAAAAAHGVVVSGTGGYVTPTSELTWALILAVQRHVPAEDAAVRAGGWQHTIGRELAGRRLGLLGLGRIGALVAEVGLAFRMDVVAWSQNLTDERAASVGVQRVGKDELFATSDVVSIHLVLSDRTRGLVGEAELAAMKPTAILVNTSRGPVVDEAALVRALQDGRIAGAGLDVFDREPLPADHPLRTAPRTVLTPHVGYVTDGLYEAFYREIVEDVAAFAAGAPLRTIAP